MQPARERLSIRAAFQEAANNIEEARQALWWITQSHFPSDAARVAAYNDSKALLAMHEALCSHPEWLMPKEGE